MARSGQGARDRPAAITAPGSSGSATRPAAPARGNRMTVGLVALGLVRHALRSRRFWEGAAVTVIALGSLRGIGQESRAGAMARLAAWNKREMQRLEHKAERQAGAVKNAAERMAHPAEGGKHGS